MSKPNTYDYNDKTSVYKLNIASNIFFKKVSTVKVFISFHLHKN